MRALLAAVLLLVATPAAATWPDVFGGAGAGVSAPNEPQDTDNDGSFDVIYCSDYDGDGTLDMQDVQACYDALTDVSGRYLGILTGTFAPGTTTNTNAYFEIVGDTNVRIECFPGAILTNHGIAAPDLNLSLIWIDDSTHVRIKGCELDGGVGASYTSLGATNIFRMGIYVHDSTDVVADDVYLHDIQSIGFFLNGTTNSGLIHSRVSRVGGYADTAVSPATNAAVEVFTDGDATSATGNFFRGNVIEYGGSIGFTERKTTATDTLRDTVFESNTIKRMDGPAIRAGGTVNSRYLSNTLIATAGCLTFDETGGVPTGYYPTDVRGSAGLLFQGNKCLGSLGTSTFAFDLTRFQKHDHYYDNECVSPQGGCWNVEQRRMGTVIKGGSVVNSVGSAFQGVAVAGTTPEEWTEYNGITITGVDADPLAHPLFLGIFNEAGADDFCTDAASPCACSPDLEGYWLVTTNASSATDVSFLGTTGDFVNRAICTSSVWTDKVTNSITAGNATAMAMVGTNERFKNLIISSFPGSAISLSGTALTAQTVFENIEIHGDRWGYVGELAEATAAGTAYDCGDNPDMEGKWAIITDASGATDCTVSASAGATANRCYCVSTDAEDVWTDEGGTIQATTRHGISLPAMTGACPVFKDINCVDLGENGNCINIPASTTCTGMRINDVVASYRIEAAASVPDTDRTNHALAVVALGTGGVADGVRCNNTDNVACIDDGFLVADHIGTGAPTAELCDSTQEVGSTWRRTDGSEDETLGYCEPGPAWDTAVGAD
jgi:hypothetical protein